MHLSEYIGIVLDPDRLAVLGQAAAGPIDVDRLADRLAIDRRELVRIVGRLRHAGLLDEQLRLDRATLRELAASRPEVTPADESLLEGPWSGDEVEILSRFFSGSRLTSIPTHRAKRLVVLERLVQEFEPGLRYDEREVNSTLQLFHADYAALRRYLVDEGLMTRADGVYWRTGGRYDEEGTFDRG